MSEDVPDHDVFIFNIAVRFGPFGQPVMPAGLVDIFARRVAFIFVVRRYPEVVFQIGGPPRDRRALLKERQHDFHRLNAVSHVGAHAVFRVRVLNAPGAHRAEIVDALRLFLSLEDPAFGVERIAVGVVGTNRISLAFGLDHLVFPSVHMHVEAGAEKVLVIRRVAAFLHHRAEFGLVPRPDRACLHDADRLDLKFDRAVLTQHPVKTVFIVSNRRDERNDQLARPARLDLFRAQIGMLPKDRVVLFVHADGVGNAFNLAEGVDVVVVEICDFTETIAAQRQRVGQGAKPVFADIEGILARRRRRGVAIGHRHFGDRCAIADLALLPFIHVVVAQVMQHQPLARIEADAEAPALPVHAPAIDGEADAFGLGDPDRFDVVAELADILALIVPHGLRHRHDPGIVDAHDLLLVQIDQRRKPFDRMRIGIVVRFFPHQEKRAAQTALGVFLVAEIPCRQRVDGDLPALGNIKAALLQRPRHLFILHAGDGHLDELILAQHRLARVGHARPFGDLAARQ